MYVKLKHIITDHCSTYNINSAKRTERKPQCFFVHHAEYVYGAETFANLHSSFLCSRDQ
jgi:hypothetical protein